MELRTVAVLVCLLVGAAHAGPINWEDSGCARTCNSQTNKFKYEVGKTYVYGYQSTSDVAVTDHAGHHLNIRMSAQAEISIVDTCEMVLRLRDVHLTGTGVEDPRAFKQALEAETLSFGYDDGVITGVCPSPEDTDEDVLNIKRAILSALQNSMKDWESPISLRETDVAGICHTKYLKASSGWSSTTVTKVKDLSSCAKRHDSTIAIFASPYLSDDSPIQNLPLLSGKIECHQTIGSGIIQKVDCVEDNVFKPFHRQGKGAAIHTKVSLVYRTTHDKVESVTGRSNFRRSDLLFAHAPSPIVKGDESGARNLLSKICEKSRDIVRSDVPHLFNNLISVLRSLPHSDVQQIFESVKSSEFCPTARDIIIDAISMTGTEGGVKTMVRLLKDKEISHIRANVWFTMMAFNTHVTEGAVAAVAQLLNDRDLTGRQALLGLSSMVYNFCAKNPNCQETKAVKDILLTLQRRLQKCRATNRGEENLVIDKLSAFENIGRLGDAKDDVLECATSESNIVAIRQAAIRALRRVPCDDKIKRKMVDLYSNTAEDVEVRIYSYVAAMRCADESVVRQIKTVMEKEPINQVGSYVWTHLTNLQETSIRHKQDVRQILTDATLSKKFSSMDFRRFSRNVEWSTFLEKINAGLGLEMDFIFSPKSYIPRNLNFNLTSDIFGQSLHLLGLQTRMEGLDHFLESYFGERGILSKFDLWSLISNATEDDAEENKSSRRTRSANPVLNKLSLMHERMDVETPRDPRVSTALTILGRKIARITWNDIQQLFDIREAIDIMEILTELAQNQKIDRSTSVKFIELQVSTASVSGMQIHLDINGTATLGIKADGKFDIRKLLTSERSADIDGWIRPSGAFEVSAVMSVRAGTHKPGLKIVSTGHSSAHIQGKMQVKEGRIIKMSVDLPREKIEILNAKTEMYLVEATGVEKPISAPNTHDVNTCGKALGVAVCMKMQLPKPLFSEKTPLIPLGGPMSIEWTLEKEDRSMQGYEFSLSLPSEHDYNERVYRIEFDTPGSRVNHHYAAEGRLNRQQQGETVVNLKLRSPKATLMGTGSLVARSDLMRGRIGVTVNGNRKYSVNAETKIQERPNQIEYVPKVEIELAGHDPLTFGGSLVRTKGGRKQQWTVDLKANKPSDKPAYIRGNVAIEGKSRLSTDINVNMPGLETRLHGTVDKQDTVLATDMTLEYQAGRQSKHSVKLTSKGQNLSTRHLTKLSAVSELQLSQLPEANLHLAWEMQHKPREHFENELTIKYGENQRPIHILQVSKLEVAKNRGKSENRLVVEAPEFIKEVELIGNADWDMRDKPRFHVDSDFKYGKTKNVEFSLDSKCKKARPMEMEIDAKLKTPEREYIYRDTLRERSPNEFEGRTMFQWKPNKQAVLDYTYRIKSDSAKTHHEIDVRLACPSFSMPLQHKALLRMTREAIDIRSNTQHEGKNIYSIDAKLTSSGPSKVELEVLGWKGEMELENEELSKTVRIELHDSEQKRYTAVAKYNADSGFHKRTFDIEVNLENQTPFKFNTALTRISNPSHRYRLEGKAKYGQFLNTKFHSEVSPEILEGPHEVTMEIEGRRIEPHSVHLSHKIENNALQSTLKISKNHVEQLMAEATGKYNRRSRSQVDLSGSIALKSPHNELNGKQIAFGYKREGPKHVTDLRLQGSPATPYTLNVEYEGESSRSKGKHEAKVLLTTPHPEYRSQEAEVKVEYTESKLDWTTDINMARGKKLHMAVDIEALPGRLTGSYELSTPFSTLSSLRLNTLTDLSDDYKTENSIDVNGDRKLAWKGQFTNPSASNKDNRLDIQSSIGPKFDANFRFTREPTKINYDLTMRKNDVEVFAAKLLHQAQGRNDNNGVLRIKKGDTTWAVDWQKDNREDGAVGYSIKSRGLGQPITVALTHKEKDNEVESELRLCLSGRDSDCLVLEGSYKKEDSAYYGTLLRELAFKASQNNEVPISIKMELNAKKDSLKHSVALEIFGRDLGYQIDAQMTDDKFNGLWKIKLPSRVLSAEGVYVKTHNSADIKLVLMGDAERQPSRKLTIDMKAKEVQQSGRHHLKIDMHISHPSLETPVKGSLDFETSQGHVRPISAKMELDYSTDPNKKVFVVAYVETPEMDKHNKTVFLNIYQADHKDLDFMWKSHVAVHDDRMTSGYHWHWTTKSNKIEGFSFLEFDHRDKQIHYYGRCPVSKNNLDVHGSWNYQPGKLLTVDLDAMLNKDPSKVKLVLDIPKPCIEILFYQDPAGTPTYRFHSCVDSTGKSLLTITSEYYEADQKITDASVVFDRRGDKTFSAHIHWNPERLGLLMYQMMQLGDALESADFEGKMEKVVEHLSSLANNVEDEILQPVVTYISKELEKLATEIAADIRHIRRSVKRAIQKLPDVHIYEPLAKIISEVHDDVKGYANEVMPECAKEMFHKLARYLEDAAQDVCRYPSPCYQLQAAYKKRGIDGVMELLYTYIANMPESYYRFAVATTDFLKEKIPSVNMEHVWKAAEKTAEKIEDILEPVMSSEAVRKVRESISRLGDSVEKIYENTYKAVWEKAENIREEIMKLPEAQAIYDILVEFYKEIASEVRKFPLETTMKKILDFAEDFLSVESLSNSIRVITLDEEKGEAQIDIHLPSDVKTLRKSFSGYYDNDDTAVSDSYNSLQSAVRKEWVPPFKAHAQIVGGQHFMTFDDSFYDFAGDCTYLLARDFADGNFTIAVKYQGQGNDGKIDKAIQVFVDDHVIEVDPDQQSVTLDDQPVDLPLFVGHVSVLRRGKTFVIDSQAGLQMICHLVHDYCTTVVSGWYYGKTAGLFGTYDNEPSNDFIRPRGRGNNPTDFARHWQLNSGCKHKNLAKEINVDSESSQFQLCQRYFRDEESPLRDCFDELDEEQYFNICVRQTTIQRNPEEALCTVAAAFVHSCRQHKLSVSLPSVCLKCESNMGSNIEYGQRRTYDEFTNLPQSTDVVFLIEERECNRKVVKDFDSIARLVDRELVNSGFSNNKYAVVAFGGRSGESEPHTHTARGKEFFGVQDVVLATEKLRFKNDKSPVDTFGALRYAIRLHFREAVSKTFVLLTCAACDEHYMSVDYSDIQRLLLDRGITLHIMNERALQVRGSSSKSRGIYSVDAHSVYRGKDISQKSLFGQPDLRSQVAVPKDICVALAQEVNGAFFTTKPLTQGSSVESKNWKSLLARRVAKTAAPHSCQTCECADSDEYDVASHICQPCNVPEPKVPITVYTSEDDDYY